MRYLVVFTAKTKEGETHYKWVSSPQYKFSAKHIIELIENKPSEFYLLTVPFILTLAASLEANLNDWLLIDTFNKYGLNNYKSLAEAYTSVSFAKKLRLVVAVLTDNSFQLQEDSSIVKKLDELISARNKITHPLSFFQVEQKAEDGKLQMDKVNSHPLQSLTIDKCREYYQAVSDFDRLFFNQYDKGVIDNNELIKWIKSEEQQTDEKPQEAS